MTKCKEPRYGLCKYLKEGSSFNFKGKQFNINADMTCTVKNVIYVIECQGYRKYYIGETDNLRNRTQLHNQHIKHAHLRMIPVSGHIASCSKIDPKYFIFPFFKINSDSIIDRKEKEKLFIQNYKPDLNSLWRVLSRDARFTSVAVIIPHKKSYDVTLQLVTLTLLNYLDSVSTYVYAQELFMALKILNT